MLFARDFVLKEPFVQREKMLQAGKGYLQERSLQETERINTAIAGLGIDWTPGPTPKAPQLQATLRPGPEKRVNPGDSFDLEVTLENKGSEPLSRIRGWTESEDPLLDRREFLFGTLKPGEKRTWKSPVKVPKDIYSRRDDVTVKFFDDQGALPQQLVAEVNFGETVRPAFALDWQVVDDCAACNGDGVAQRGESVTLLVDVTNQGPGKALDVFGSIKNAADQNVFIEKGRFKLGEIAPGETKTARFQLEVKKGYVGDSFPLKLAVVDEPLEEFVTERLTLPLADKPYPVELKKGLVQARGRRSGARRSGRPRPGDGAGEEGRGTHRGRPGERAHQGGPRQGPLRVHPRRRRARGRPTAKAAAPELVTAPYREPPVIALQVDQSQGGVVAPSGIASPSPGPSPSRRACSTCTPGQRPEGVLPHLGQSEERADQAQVQHRVPAQGGREHGDGGRPADPGLRLAQGAHHPPPPRRGGRGSRPASGDDAGRPASSQPSAARSTPGRLVMHASTPRRGVGGRRPARPQSTPPPRDGRRASAGCPPR